MVSRSNKVPEGDLKDNLRERKTRQVRKLGNATFKSLGAKEKKALSKTTTNQPPCNEKIKKGGRKKA